MVMVRPARRIGMVMEFPGMGEDRRYP